MISIPKPSTDIPESLADLRDARDAVGLRIEILALEKQARLLGIGRSEAVTESRYLPIDRYDRLSNEASNWQTSTGYGTLMGAQIGDRKHGALWPLIRTQLELASVWAGSRIIEATSDTARGILEDLANYTFGTGMGYEIMPKADKSLSAKDRIDKTKGKQSIVLAVQEVLDDLLERSDWVNGREKRVFKRSRRDGDAFIAIFPMQDGRVSIRIVPPENIVEPANARSVENKIGSDFESDWSFGIHTTKGDREDIHGYYVQWSDDSNDWDYIPTSRMVHIKLNVDDEISRGLSDFFANGKTIEHVDKLLANSVCGAAVLANIIAVRQHSDGVTQDQVETFRNSGDHIQANQQTPQGTQLRHIQKYMPATTLDISGGVEYKDPPFTKARFGDSLVTVQQAGLRSIHRRWSMPEFMTGDASNANFSSTIVAESPFVRAIESAQGDYSKAYQKLLTKCLTISADNGLFREEGVNSARELWRQVEVSVESSSIATRNRLEETQRHLLLNEQGLLAAETWATMEDLDLEEQEAKGAKRQESTQFEFGRGGEGVSPPALLRPPSLSSQESRHVHQLARVADVIMEGYP